MASDGRSGMEAPCPYGVCQRGRLCPPAVQVALATTRLRVPGRSEGTIVSTDVIAAHDAASRALAGLGKRRGGGGGSPSPVGKERAEESEGRSVQSLFRSVDVNLS